jgi:AcrR family transcriptional regulator
MYALVNCGGMRPPIPSFRDRQRQFREDAILEATHELLAQKGFVAMTMDDVAQRVGIAKGSLYQHFKSKEELLAAVLISFMDRISTFIENLPSKQSRIDRLKQTYRRAIELRFQQGFPDLFNAKPSVKDVLIKNAAYVASSDRMWDALERLFDDAKRAGDITTEIPTEVLVHSAIATVRDSELDSLIDTGRITREALSEFLVQMFFGGILARPSGRRKSRAAKRKS